MPASLRIKTCVLSSASNESSAREMRSVLAGKENRLFLSVVQPHKPVSASMVARWVWSLLQAAGIDTSQFKPHSVRGASASDAAKGGVALSDILGMACWSSDSTLKRFYYKPVLPPDVSWWVLSVPRVDSHLWTCIVTWCRTFWSIISDYRRDRRSWGIR